MKDKIFDVQIMKNDKKLDVEIYQTFFENTLDEKYQR